MSPKKKKAPKAPVYVSRIIRGGYPVALDMDRPFPIRAWFAHWHSAKPLEVELRFKKRSNTKWYRRQGECVAYSRPVGGPDRWSRVSYGDYFLLFNEARAAIIRSSKAEVKRDEDDLVRSRAKLKDAMDIPRCRKKESAEFPPRPAKKAAKEAKE